jgi:4,5-DOPA dioxygenase extradiol
MPYFRNYDLCKVRTSSINKSREPAMSHQPSLFVPHGAPTFMLHPGAAGAALAALARLASEPRAVVIVSAHWDTPVARVGFSVRPETMHDYYGFPKTLYQLRYSASGCPEVAAEVLDALHAAGIEAEADLDRGLDHGAWMPMMMLYPDADVAVVPLSIQSGKGPRVAWELGRALAPLRESGILVIGSGNVTHNLADYRRATDDVPEYVRRFADWVAGRLAEGDIEGLLEYRERAPDALRAHPTEEHLLPLFVALGAAGVAPMANRVHASIQDRVLAMDVYRFTAGGQA